MGVSCRVLLEVLQDIDKTKKIRKYQLLKAKDEVLPSPANGCLRLCYLFQVVWQVQYTVIEIRTVTCMTIDPMSRLSPSLIDCSLTNTKYLKGYRRQYLNYMTNVLHKWIKHSNNKIIFSRCCWRAFSILAWVPNRVWSKPQETTTA